MTDYYIATHNPNKIAELQRILIWTGNHGYPYTDLIPRQRYPKESNDSYRANAINKALFISHLLPNRYVIADDSGLQLAAFPEWLGVTTGRDLSDYPTPEAYDEAILAKLKGHERGFTMVSWLVCAYNDEIIATSRAMIHGRVAHQQRGTYTRGFDRILIPDGEDQTLAEMPFDQRYYHLVRSKAVNQLLAKLRRTQRWRL